MVFNLAKILLSSEKPATGAATNVAHRDHEAVLRHHKLSANPCSFPLSKSEQPSGLESLQPAVTFRHCGACTVQCLDPDDDMIIRPVM
mmetsp:Transcript_39721/g.89095  ORF Transcript_39721/g.89095 Transcript_39721/m.89095 type:complete len:88 (+) Transcript_39721:98-361(+)